MAEGQHLGLQDDETTQENGITITLWLWLSKRHLIESLDERTFVPNNNKIIAGQCRCPMSSPDNSCHKCSIRHVMAAGTALMMVVVGGGAASISVGPTTG